MWNLVVVLASLIGDSLILIGNEKTLSCHLYEICLIFSLSWDIKSESILCCHIIHNTWRYEYFIRTTWSKRLVKTLRFCTYSSALIFRTTFTGLCVIYLYIWLNCVMNFFIPWNKGWSGEKYSLNIVEPGGCSSLSNRG